MLSSFFLRWFNVRLPSPSLLLLAPQQLPDWLTIIPPAAELHDDQPGVSNGRSWGMPVDDYVEQTISGLKQGKLDVPVGTSVLSYDKVEAARSEARQGLLSALAKSS
ncbi:hypothetical protein MPH_12506 [Macrophomina phaseolina MS6]|uniref:Uncharacterized protein n=1 Tax=Macrophomina phaseolina (strain MS6) TaxID=1126212 RepID=K2RBX5_MACPH|nr:hypothetical protein MPH_12506 [Macrophomina phaseolina MS6]